MKTDSRSAYGAKLRQCNKEALASVAALAATVVVWAVCGFGLSELDVWICGVPLWAAAGTLGTWVFAIIVSVILAKRFFKDFDVDEPDSAANAPATAAGEGGER